MTLSDGLRSADQIMDEEFRRAMSELQQDDPEIVRPSTSVVPPSGDEAANATYMTEEVCVRIRNMLGIKPESWARIMPEVRELVPRYALHKIAARISLNMGFENIGQLSQAVEIGKSIMENDKNEAHTRVAAGKMISNAVEAMGKMFPELLRLADAGGDKTAADDQGNGVQKPKNLPPMLNVQVNVTGNGHPTYPAGAVVKSGNGIRNLLPGK